MSTKMENVQRINALSVFQIIHRIYFFSMNIPVSFPVLPAAVIKWKIHANTNRKPITPCLVNSKIMCLCDFGQTPAHLFSYLSHQNCFGGIATVYLKPSKVFNINVEYLLDSRQHYVLMYFTAMLISRELYCTVLYCNLLCCAVMPSMELYSILLHCCIFYCVVLCWYNLLIMMIFFILMLTYRYQNRIIVLFIREEELTVFMFAIYMYRLMGRKIRKDFLKSEQFNVI